MMFGMPLMQQEISTPQKQHEYLQLLYRVNDMLREAEADGLDIDRILPRILGVAAEEISADSGSIIIVAPERGVEYSWSVSRGESYQTKLVPFIQEVMTHGIGGLAVRTEETVCIENTLTDPRWLRREDHPTAWEPWSAICAPLFVQRQAIGILTVTKAGVAAFDRDQVGLLSAIANQAAVTIENARLYATSQRQLREAELFNAASQAINSSLDLHEVMQSMLSQMNELLNADSISIARVDGDELEFTVADGAGRDEIVGLRIDRHTGFAGWVMTNREPVLSNHPRDDMRFAGAGDERTGMETEAIIVAPLEADGRIMGTMQAINPPNGYFTEHDLNILTRLANLASNAIAKSEQFQLTQAAQRRYTNLFEDSIDPILVTDLDGTIRVTNRRVSSFLGYERGELIGKSIDTLHRNPLVSAVLLEEGGVVQTLERMATTRSGDLIAVEVHVKRTAGSADSAQSESPTPELQWIYHDVSKQKELEQMRNDLTAMLFHDLQNPLSNVISSLELLEGDLLPEDTDPIAQMMITVAYRSSQRLRHLIRSLLDVSQLEAGHPVHEQFCVSINEILDYVVEMMEVPLQTKGIQVAQCIEEGLPEVYVNSDMIERVIINLFDNSVKFSKRGDTITLAAKRSDDGSSFCFRLPMKGLAFRLSIASQFSTSSTARRTTPQKVLVSASLSVVSQSKHMAAPFGLMRPKAAARSSISLFPPIAAKIDFEG